MWGRRGTRPPALAALLLVVATAKLSAQVTGRVIDPEGSAVEGAAVHAFAQETAESRAARLLAGQGRVPLAAVRSAGDGSFRLAVQGALVDLDVRAEGYAPSFQVAPNGETVPVVLRRAPLRRGVVTAKGRPVAGASVVLTASREGDDAAGDVVVTSGPDGSYAVPDPEGWAGKLVVLHPDFAPHEAYRGDGRWVLRHELGSGVAIEGSVLEARTGRPVAGATLWVDAWPLGRSDAGGTFRIPRAPPGWQGVLARGSGLVGASQARAGGIVIEAQPARALSGVVRDAKTRRPLSGAVVALRSEAGAAPLTATSDASGRYAFPSLAAARYWAYALRHGYAPADWDAPDDGIVDLRAAPASRRDFELEKLRRLTGRVVDEVGAPVAGALVVAAVHGSVTLYSHADAYGDWGATARTAADGGFTLDLPREGSRRGSFEQKAGLIVLKQGYAAGRLEPARLRGAADRRLTITLSRGIELAGRVTDAEGAPLPGVAVALAEDSAFAGGALSYLLLSRVQGEGWTTSGPDGRFAARVQPALHHVAFRKGGHAPKLVRSHDPRGGASLEVVLDPAAEVRGRVSFADGSGVPDAAVELRQQPGLVAATAATDGAGGFVLGDLAPGPYELVVSREDAGIYETRAVDAPASDVHVELGPRGALQGRVVDVRSREPVPRFSLALERDPVESAAEWRTRRHLDVDDPAGTFVFAGIPAGDVTLVVRAAGYVPKRVAGLAVPGGGELPELEVALDAGATIRGRVTSREGKPIADASVAVVEDAGDAPSAESDEHGEYELTGVAPGQVTLDFRAGGYRRSRRTLEAAPPLVTLDATLSRGLSVSGTVVSDGAGVANASVAASSGALEADYQAAVTDARGRFTIEGLAPGRYSITATADGMADATLEDVNAETARALRLVLERRASAILSGSVSGLPVGEEVLGGMVIATGEDGQSEYAPVDAAGVFRMEKAPAGRVKVRAVATSFSGATRSSRTNELTLAPGSENQTVIEFAAGAVIAGVVTRDGTPLSDATVSFQAADDGDVRSSARSDARGQYEITGVETGLYRVAVAAAGAAFEMEYVVTGSDRLDLDLSVATLRGSTLDAASGLPIPGVEVSFWRLGGRENVPERAVTSNAQGEFATRSLREGRYRVLTSKPGYGQELREVELSRDAASELVLELAAVEGLSVRVVDARDDRPLDATVVVRDLDKRIVANRHGGVAADGTLNVALAAGPYLLSTSATGYGTVTLPVTAPGDGFRVGLTPGGTLVLESERDLRGHVRLVGSDGEEYVRCWCNGIADIQLEGRRTSVPHVTPGSYTLEVVDVRGSASGGGSVVIREGAVSTVTIQ